MEREGEEDEDEEPSLMEREGRGWGISDKLLKCNLVRCVVVRRSSLILVLSPSHPFFTPGLLQDSVLPSTLL